VLFQDIENSLTYLEEIVIIQKVQETQLERRFKLAMHKENKLKHLETLRGKYAVENKNNMTMVIQLRM
jgi:hypothetical protein